MTKRLLEIVSGILPAAAWEKIEYAAAYFAGKGSGSASLAAEVKAAARFMHGEGLVVFDVGANKGDWTAALFDRLGSRVSSVYQFEPSPHNVALLEKRFSNGKVLLVPRAASDGKGEAELFSDAPGSGAASLHHRRLDHFDISLDTSTRVATVTLDDVIAEYKITKVDFMKMDIEGHEFAALQGAKNALRRGIISALSFEFGGANIDSRTYFQDFWYFLVPLGFIIFRILPNGSVLRIKKYSEMLEIFRTSNYLAVLSHE